MEMRLCLIIAIALVFVGIAACGDDSTSTTQSRTTEPAPAAQPTSAPTAEPTAAPTAMPEPTPMAAVPTPEPTAAPPPPTPTATASPEATSMMDGGIELPDDCLPGGAVDNAATVLSCSVQAIQQVKSFSFEGEIDLLALFPVDDAGAGGRGDTDERGYHPAGQAPIHSLDGGRWPKARNKRSDDRT